MESESKLAATTLDRRIAVVRYSASARPEQATLGRLPCEAPGWDSGGSELGQICLILF